jgi:putative peptidoglycan lipid II flippase
MLSEDSHLIRASSLMALGTITSRVTGLVRNLLLVAVLGTGLLGDTYNVGNTVPNILYNLLIGGALTAVFVPQIVRAFRDSDGGDAFISRLVSLISTVLLALTVLAMLATPLFVRLYAPAFEGRPREITLAFTLYCLPQILFYGLFGILGQVSNAKERFGPMMWAPVANNLLVIALFSYFLTLVDEFSLQSITDQQVFLLGAGTTLGILIQSLILIPYIKRSGVTIRPRFDWRGVGLGKSIRLGSWMFLFVLISQVGFLITVNLATRAAVKALDEGISYGLGYTPYANAYLLLLLPHSVVAISVVTALLPQISNLVINQQIERVKERLVTAIKFVGIVTTPAMFFFYFFGPLIGNSIFFGVDEESRIYIGKVLSILAFAAIPLSINLIFTRGINAFENTKYQVLSNLGINVVAIGISLLVFHTFETKNITLGLAAAFSLSYWFGLILTYFLLRKFTGPWQLRPIVHFHLRLSIASALALIPAFFIVKYFDLAGNILTLFLVLGTGALFYLLAARMMKIDEVSQMIKLLLRR